MNVPSACALNTQYYIIRTSQFVIFNWILCSFTTSLKSPNANCTVTTSKRNKHISLHTNKTTCIIYKIIIPLGQSRQSLIILVPIIITEFNSLFVYFLTRQLQGKKSKRKKKQTQYY
jgi:hypothetical protein